MTFKLCEGTELAQTAKPDSKVDANAAVKSLSRDQPLTPPQKKKKACVQLGMGHQGKLWLRGRASVLLSEGCLFDSPGLHAELCLGKILNPKLPLMCCLAPYMAATAISV